MPSLEFKGKSFIHTHRLGVPYRELLVVPEKSWPAEGHQPDHDDNHRRLACVSVGTNCVKEALLRPGRARPSLAPPPPVAADVRRRTGSWHFRFDAHVVDQPFIGKADRALAGAGGDLNMELNEDSLVQKSIAYLKRHYGEDTVRMDIRKNGVVEGNGVLEVDCTVSVHGAHSDWTKWFSFKNGFVTGMRWAQR
jgi:hypothetical protein